LELERLFAIYEEGAVTALEAASFTIRQVTPENAQDVIQSLRACPEVYAAVEKKVLQYATLTEEQRANMKTFQMGSYIIRSDADLEKFEAERENERKAYDAGLRTLCEVWPASG
jgi:hypothetical protein